eukprot:Nk52_evm1s172 gene=Nk52_evmTU1s172
MAALDQQVEVTSSGKDNNTEKDAQGGKGGGGGGVTRGKKVERDWEGVTCDVTDHAETPLQAYRDIAPLLHRLGKRLYSGKKSQGTEGGGGGAPPSARLRIYDPYYCEGQTVRHLELLGFPCVYNRNEDFYEAIRMGTCPEYDVLVTNPPFSGDNIERLMRFCAEQGKPFLILMPQYVSRKWFYVDWLRDPSTLCSGGSFSGLECDDGGSGSGSESVGGDDDMSLVEMMRGVGISGGNNNRSGGMVGEKPKPVYLAPKRSAYVFEAPSSARDVETGEYLEGEEKESGVQEENKEDGSGDGQKAFQVKAGSFQCIWFVWMGNGKDQDAIVHYWKNNYEGAEGCDCVIARDVKALPDLREGGKKAPVEKKEVSSSLSPKEIGARTGRQRQPQQQQGQQRRGQGTGTKSFGRGGREAAGGGRRRK